MKNSIIFIIFIVYTTIIFFLNSMFSLLVALIINIILMLLLKVNVVSTMKYILKISPFILVTVILNWILSNYEYSILVGIKLLLVCHITYLYSKTTTVRKIANTIKNICYPLKLINVNTNDIEVMVCISLSMIPILKRECNQIKDACIAKGMKINIKNIKIVLSKLIISILKRVNEIEDSLIEKGYVEE